MTSGSNARAAQIGSRGSCPLPGTHAAYPHVDVLTEVSDLRWESDLGMSVKHHRHVAVNVVGGFEYRPADPLQPGEMVVDPDRVGPYPDKGDRVGLRERLRTEAL